MKIIKKVMGSILSGIMLLQMGTIYVYAEGSARLTDVESIIASQEFFNCEVVLKNSTEIFGIEEDLIYAYIGTPFMMYCIDDEMNCILYEETMYYPVYAEDKMVAIILVHDDGERLDYSCGKYFADELQVYSEMNDTYALVGDAKGNLFAVNHVDEPVLLGSDIGDEDATLDGEVQVELNISNSAICEKVADMGTMQTMSTRAVTAPIHLDNYPLCKQTGNNCWAYTLFSMAKFLGKYVAIEQVYGAYYRAIGKNYVINSGAMTDEILATAQEIFDDRTCHELQRQMYRSEFKNTIDRGLPAYIEGMRVENGNVYGHGVALMGYQLISDHVGGFYYMNPQEGNIRYAGRVADEHTAHFYGVTANMVYDWVDTITLY